MPLDDRIERARRDRETRERATLQPSAWPPPVIAGSGSRHLDETHEHVAGKFASAWKIGTVVVAAMAAGFGGGKALTPDYTAQLQKLQDGIAANEHARQLDQQNVQATIAGLHEEISVLKYALRIAPALEVKPR